MHYLKVNDIVKFGRVNFKVSIIKSDKVREDIQGGYDLLEKKNQEIQEQLQKIQDLQTQQKTQAENDDGNFTMNFGGNSLDKDLMRRHDHKSSGQVQTKNQNDPYDYPIQTTLMRNETRGDDVVERQPTQENVLEDGEMQFGLGNLQQNLESRN